MNRRYYAGIYLNRHPDALDMSMLDTKERIGNEKRYNTDTLMKSDSIIQFMVPSDNRYYLCESLITNDTNKNAPDKLWLKIEADIQIDKGLNGSYLNSELVINDSVKHNFIRLFNPVSTEGVQNNYAFYIYVPAYFADGMVKLYINSWQEMKGTITAFRIVRLKR